MGLTFVSRGMTGFFNVSRGITLALCSICLGCELQRAFSKQKPQRCAGDTCAYVPPKRGERHTVQPESQASV